jgi:hypothetical protein
LLPGERHTVPCETGLASLLFGRPEKIDRADLALVVYFRPWPFTLIPLRRLFRFVARRAENGQLIWEPRASSDLQPDFDKFIAQGK